MNREVHVRFWESPEVKVLRATRQTLHFHLVALTSGLSQLADMLGGNEYCRQRSAGLATPSEWLDLVWAVTPGVRFLAATCAHEFPARASAARPGAG
jgi:hypothetical protein